MILIAIDKVRNILRASCRAAGSQAKWARRHGISQTYVTDVLNGRREPGPAMLEVLHLERVLMYVEKDKLPEVVEMVEDRILRSD